MKRLLLFFSAIVAANAQPLDPSVLRLVQPHPTLVAGISWRKAFASATGELIRKQLKQEGLGQIPQLADAEKTLTEDIDTILLSTSATEPSKAGKDTPVLVIVRGRFDRAAVQKWFPGKVEKYKTVEMLVAANTKASTSRAALLDANTLLLGDRKELLAAIDRMGRTATPGKIFERAAGLASTHDLWVVAEVPEGAMKSASGQAPPFLDQVNGLDLGVSFGKGFALAANLQAKSSEGAGALAAMIQGLIGMAALKSQETPETAEMLRKIRVTEGPSAVQLSLSLTEDEIQTAFAKTQTQRAAGPVSKPESARQPKSIRIVGMESGSVEVPIQK